MKGKIQMVMSDEEHQELIKELERQAAEGANHLLRQLQKEPVMRLARLHALGVVLGMISQSIDDAPVNRRRHPEAQLWNRCAKPAEEGGEVIKALIGVTAGNPRKGADHTLDDVREELLDTAVSALCAWEHLDGNRGHVIDEFLRFIYERRLDRMTDPATGRLRAELAQDLIGPDYQWDDRPQRTDPHAAVRREAAPPLPKSEPFPWAKRAMTDTHELAEAARAQPTPVERAHAMADAAEELAEATGDPVIQHIAGAQRDVAHDHYAQASPEERARINKAFEVGIMPVASPRMVDGQLVKPVVSHDIITTSDPGLSEPRPGS